MLDYCIKSKLGGNYEARLNMFVTASSERMASGILANAAAGSLDITQPTIRCVENLFKNEGLFTCYLLTSSMACACACASVVDCMLSLVQK